MSHLLAFVYWGFCLPSHNNHEHLHLCKHMQSVLKLAKHFQLVARYVNSQANKCHTFLRCVHAFCITVTLPCGSHGQPTAAGLFAVLWELLCFNAKKHPCCSVVRRVRNWESINGMSCYKCFLRLKIVVEVSLLCLAVQWLFNQLETHWH